MQLRRAGQIIAQNDVRQHQLAQLDKFNLTNYYIERQRKRIKIEYRGTSLIAARRGGDHSMTPDASMLGRILQR